MVSRRDVLKMTAGLPLVPGALHAQRMAACTRRRPGRRARSPSWSRFRPAGRPTSRPARLRPISPRSSGATSWSRTRAAPAAGSDMPMWRAPNPTATP